MRSGVLALMAKDFEALRREGSAAFTLIVMLIVSPLLASAPGVLTLAITVFMLSSYTITVFSIEEKYHTERFTGSLPVRRRDIVIARYAGSAAVLAVYFVLAFLINSAELLIGNPFTQPIPLGYCAAVIAAVALISALSYPLYFRLGILKARLVTFLLYMGPVLLGGIAGGLGMAGYGPASVADLAKPAPAVFSFSPLVSMALLAGAVLLWTGSIPIAVRLYARRDL